MKLFKLTFLAAAFGVVTLVPFQSSAQSNAELQMMYMNILNRYGLEGTVDSDGDVRFNYDDKTYFIEVDQDDAEFFRLVLANIWPIEDELERLQVKNALDVANAKVKVGKGFIVRDNVWISVEAFHEPGEFDEFFERYLDVIDLFVRHYVEEMD